MKQIRPGQNAGRPIDQGNGKEKDRETKKPKKQMIGRLEDREIGIPGDREREMGRKIQQRHKVDSKKMQK